MNCQVRNDASSGVRAGDILQQAGMQRPALSIGQVQSLVGTELGFSVKHLRRRGRKLDVARARMIAVYFCREFTAEKAGRIARAFNRERTLVRDACKRIPELARDDESLRTRLEDIRRCLYALARAERACPVCGALGCSDCSDRP